MSLVSTLLEYVMRNPEEYANIQRVNHILKASD